MQKGEISGRFNTLRNRGEGSDKGIYWVSRRMGLIRNGLLIVGFLVFGVYLYFWFQQHGETFKKPCQKAYEQQFAGPVLKVFLDEDSHGIVTVQVLNGTDTVEYFTGWGGIKNAGDVIHKGDNVIKRANSFDLQVLDSGTIGKARILEATVKACE
jgi:hypothetical protein